MIDNVGVKKYKDRYATDLNRHRSPTNKTIKLYASPPRHSGRPPMTAAKNYRSPTHKNEDLNVKKFKTKNMFSDLKQGKSNSPKMRKKVQKF